MLYEVKTDTNLNDLMKYHEIQIIWKYGIVKSHSTYVSLNAFHLTFFFKICIESSIAAVAKNYVYFL